MKNDAEVDGENWLDRIDEDEITCTSGPSGTTHFHSALSYEVLYNGHDGENALASYTADDLDAAAVDRIIPPMLYNYLVLLQILISSMLKVV